MVKLHTHSVSEEPTMAETVQRINDALFMGQAAGLSLSGGLNCLMHAMAMTLVSAYDSPATREQVASSIPDIVAAYIPQWEVIIANARKMQGGSA